MPGLEARAGAAPAELVGALPHGYTRLAHCHVGRKRALSLQKMSSMPGRVIGLGRLGGTASVGCFTGSQASRARGKDKFLEREARGQELKASVTATCVIYSQQVPVAPAC